MNFLEVSLKTEHTSVPAHLKIYCSDELVFDDLIDKNLVIKKQLRSHTKSTDRKSKCKWYQFENK